VNASPWSERLGALPEPTDASFVSALSVAVVDSLVEALRAERGYLVRPEGDWERPSFKVQVARGFGGESLSKRRIKASTTVLKRVLDRGRGLVTSAPEDADVVASTSLREQQVLSVLCVPIFGRGQIRTVLYLDHRFHEGAFSPQDLRLVQAFGEQLGPALTIASQLSQLSGGAAADAVARMGRCLQAAGKVLESAPSRTAPRGQEPTPVVDDRTRTRVMLVDDHPIVRQGMRVIIDKQPDLLVCEVAASRTEALEKLSEARPDIVVVDLSLATGGDGLELLKDLRARQADLPMLVLSMHPESLYVERVLRAGARGYVAKQVGTDKLLGAIRQVLAGELYVSEESAQQLGRLAAGTEAPESPLQKLSDRELQVFSLIGAGQGTSQIAFDLTLSVKTIETYRTNIKRKLGLRDAAELVQHAVRWTQQQAGG
jgi:DNA-binding NarL/FixJ family response regulator